MDQIWVQSNWVQVETEFVLNELLFLAVGMFFFDLLVNARVLSLLS